MKPVLKLATGFIAFVLAGSSALVLSSTERVSAKSLNGVDKVQLLGHRNALESIERADTTPNQVPSTDAATSNSAGDVSSASTLQAPLSGLNLVEALQNGGYVILFRHAQTEQNYRDNDNAKMGDCSTQRMLSTAGWQQARAIGHAFEALNIPVGQVYSSEYCRAWQTADLAFGRYEAIPILNSLPDAERTEEQTSQMRTAIVTMLATLPPAGTNTVLVGHYDVFSAAVGINLEMQGNASILKPDGQGGFEIIASLDVDGWQQLAQSHQQPLEQQSSSR